MSAEERNTVPDAHNACPGRICPACSAFICAISPKRASRPNSPRGFVGTMTNTTPYERERRNELEKVWVGDVSPLSKFVGCSQSNCYTCYVLAPLRDDPDFQHWRDTVVHKTGFRKRYDPFRTRDSWIIYFGTIKGLAKAKSFSVSRINEKDVASKSSTGHTTTNWQISAESREHHNTIANGPNRPNVAAEDSPHRPFIAVDSIPANLLTSAGMRVVREKWLPDCLQDHPQCRKRYRDRSSTHADRGPTRVIHVQDSGHARLVETASVPADDFRYLTLSHGWGSVGFLTLTIDNLDSFRERIPLERADFNRTFREAIAVTALLGYSYIWIDSLCIIQDSPGAADWAAECPRMSAVYSESDLNLSASGYADGREGMLSMSREALVPPLFQLSDGDYARVVVNKEYGGDWPLEERGWVLQENLLVSIFLFHILISIGPGLLMSHIHLAGSAHPSFHAARPCMGVPDDRMFRDLAFRANTFRDRLYRFGPQDFVFV